MPSISSCPTCHRDLTIPDLADRQQSLRCPLCDAQFAAEQVLADCVNFPPAAILVDAADRLPAAGFEESIGEGPQFSMSDEPVAATNAGEAWGSAALPETAEQEEGFETSHKAEEEWASPVPAESDASAAEPAVSESAEASEPAEDAGGTEDETSEKADYEAFGRQVASMRVAPKAKRQASALGALGQLMGMALGGVLGLAIGYYVLIWIGGSQADFLELRGKLPRWLRPPAGRHNSVSGPAPLAHQNTGREEPDRPFADMLGQGDVPALAVPPADSVVESVAAEVDDMPADDVTFDTGHAEPTGVETNLRFADRSTGATSQLPESYCGPKGFRLRTAAELETALEQTDRALRCPRCQKAGAIRLASFSSPAPGAEPAHSARPCEYCRGKPVLHLTADGFDRLCVLAEAVTFVQFEADDENREALRDAAETILMAIGNQRDKSEIVGRLAGERLDDSARQANGIVIAGTVQETQSEGDLFAIRLLLFGTGKQVTVVSRQAPEPSVNKRDGMVVMGSIVDTPTENLAGYSGTAPQVIWGGLHCKVVP
jgi:hypothetical protein